MRDLILKDINLFLEVASKVAEDKAWWRTLTFATNPSGLSRIDRMRHSYISVVSYEYNNDIQIVFLHMAVEKNMSQQIHNMIHVIVCCNPLGKIIVTRFSFRVNEN